MNHTQTVALLGLDYDELEREIKNDLILEISELLLELGESFFIVGKQYKIEIRETDYS